MYVYIHAHVYIHLYINIYTCIYISKFIKLFRYKYIQTFTCNDRQIFGNVYLPAALWPRLHQ